MGSFFLLKGENMPWIHLVLVVIIVLVIVGLAWYLLGTTTADARIKMVINVIIVLALVIWLLLWLLPHLLILV
jgi:hypothetical protein